MAVEPPLSVAPTPVPAPQRGDRATFSPRYDAHITWQINAVAQFNAVAVNVSHNAADAALSATAAYTQAALATDKAGAAQVSATSAATSASSANTFRNYAADSAAAALASASASEASSTTAQTWATAAIAAGALAGVPGFTGNARKALVANASETGLEFTEVVTRVLAYTARASLRGVETLPTQYLVRQLGLFEWQAGSTEPDDDASCFRTASGAWTMIAADPDFAAELWLAEQPLRGRVQMTLTSLVAGAFAEISAAVPGARVGDSALVTPGVLLPAGVTVQASVASAGTITLRIANGAAGTATLSPSMWSLLIL